MSELKINDIILGNEYTIHNNGKLVRIVPIHTNENKSFYFTTSELTNCDLLCKYYKHPYEDYRFVIINNSMNNNNNTCISLVNQLNIFKNDIINKLKYIIKIPTNNEQKEYSLKVNRKKHIINNILQYNNKSVNLPFDIVKNIIKYTKYKLLIHIISLNITHNNIYLNLRISRIIPNSIDNLHTNDKIFIYNIINSNLLNNYQNIVELNNVYVNNYKSKNTIKNELYNLL